MRVIEVGHVLYSPTLQRTPLGTEAQYLLARYAFETLGYRRYEWKCNALNAASRRAALRYGFTYEGIIAPANDRQGPQPRQRLVLHARQRMAGAQGNFERWLAPENFASDGRQKMSLERDERRGGMSLPVIVRPVAAAALRVVLAGAGRQHHGLSDAGAGDRLADLSAHQQRLRSRPGRIDPVRAGGDPDAAGRPRRRPLRPAADHPRGAERPMRWPAC